MYYFFLIHDCFISFCLFIDRYGYLCVSLSIPVMPQLHAKLTLSINRFMFLLTTTVCFSRLTQSDKHPQYTFSSDSFSSAPPLGNKMHSLEATGQDYVRNGTIVYEFVHRILLLQSLMPSSSSLCLPFCDGIRLLFSTDEENPYLLLSLKEGRDRLILITSGGDVRLLFPGWKLSNIFHFSCSTDRKERCLCIDVYTLQNL